ncbi:MAG TPA: FAD:protein FMN transferase [Ramlibacter sp.]|uniref:FAD:protein FMN transferase n=1 Tax=Ramlibacter sp. TaxID=1917967 RepID=UPI002D80BF2C|nr:FAD:protein FMN transferase [Ramlibacter sp.]HET8748282.1 FAD:protein FMN transferase [Ramlibacter sp.]
MSKTSIEWLPALRLQDCRISGDTMGTRYTARFHAPVSADVQAIADALEAAVTTVDRQMSNWKPDSDLSRLNRAAPDVWTPIPPKLALVLQRAVEIGRESDNAFHIGVGDLVDAWGFGPAAARQLDAPAAQPRLRTPIEQLLEVDVPGCRARKHGPVALDLCGIAKGFGVDELARVLDGYGLQSWLAGIDGELRARGTKPDGTGWSIALEKPSEDVRAAMAVIELQDGAIATSGDYRHWAKVAGQRVSHTMDPRTGAPLRSALASVTVVARRCMDADAYATALMVLGEEAGRAHAQRAGLDALFVVREGERWRASGTGCFAEA